MLTTAEWCDIVSKMSYHDYELNEILFGSYSKENCQYDYIPFYSIEPFDL